MSHVLECAGMHAECVCVCVCVFSIDQVSVVGVERAGLDKLDDATAPHTSVSFWLLVVRLLKS